MDLWTLRGKGCLLGIYIGQHRSLYNLGQEVRDNIIVLGAQGRVPCGFALMTTGDRSGHLPSFQH